jgi:hypothetical protein
MAAVAGAWALDVSPELIGAGLRTLIPARKPYIETGMLNNPSLNQFR